MRYVVMIALALSLSLALNGCAFFRGHWGEGFNSEDIAAIKKGTTTRADIAARFGAPDEIVHAAERDIFHYRRYDSKLGYIVIFSRFNIMGDHLYIFFNREGIVDEVVFGNRTDRLQFQFWPFGE